MIITTNQTFDTMVYFVSADNTLDMLSKDVSEYAINTVDFKGKMNETFVHLGPNTYNTVLVGLGESDKLTKDHFVQAANTVAKALNKHKVTATSIQPNTYDAVNQESVLQGVVE